MSHFRHIDTLAVDTVASEVQRMRVDLYDPQRDFIIRGLRHKSIFLRCHDGVTLGNWLEDLPVYDWPILQGWSAMQSLLRDARAKILADPHFAPLLDHTAPMGRAVLSVIDPHGYIQWHTDLGTYAANHRRFHIPLVTSAEAIVYASAEQVRLPVGALTWLDVQVPHSAGNWSPAWRTHAVFELRARVA